MNRKSAVAVQQNKNNKTRAMLEKLKCALPWYNFGVQAK
jgi:hypothetical protein